MKKILPATLAFILVVPLLTGFKNVPVTKVSPPIISATLNGIDAGTATTMISNFAGNYMNDKGPKSVTEWYSAAQIKAIYDLLTSEAATVGTDGIRIYLGSDQPSGAGHKLHVKLLLVSTKPQGNGGIATKSTHADYYEHAASFLTTEAGEEINDDPTTAISKGALLYGGNPPSATPACANPTSHYLDNNKAYSWVQTRNHSNAHQEVYDTKSDWFNWCFLSSLFSIITAPNSQFDGLRIYLGKGTIRDGRNRDVIILVPTKANGTRHDDFYDCLEDLAPKDHPFCYGITRGGGGGYDEGELCPDVCN